MAPALRAEARVGRAWTRRLVTTSSPYRRAAVVLLPCARARGVFKTIEAPRSAGGGPDFPRVSGIDPDVESAFLTAQNESAWRKIPSVCSPTRTARRMIGARPGRSRGGAFRHGVRPSTIPLADYEITRERQVGSCARDHWVLVTLVAVGWLAEAAIALVRRGGGARSDVAARLLGSVRRRLECARAHRVESVEFGTTPFARGLARRRSSARSASCCSTGPASSSFAAWVSSDSRHSSRR